MKTGTAALAASLLALVGLVAGPQRPRLRLRARAVWTAL